MTDPAVAERRPRPTASRGTPYRGGSRRATGWAGERDRPLRGRHEPLERVGALLSEAAESGSGRVMIIDGAPGIGKTRLLSEAGSTATASGFQVVQGEVDPPRWPRQVPPVLAVLGETPRLRPSDRPDDDRAGPVEHLQSYLRQRASSGPLLVALDDLHRADPVTATALRKVSGTLATAPVVWLLARRSGACDTEVDGLVEDFERRGLALHTELGPLSDQAVKELVADLIQAEPGPDVTAFAEAADGNPSALLELVQGLLDEGRIDRNGDLAHLNGTTSPPRRFQALVARRVAMLTPRARSMLEVAAVLGDTFIPDDLSEMLGDSPAALLPALREVLASRLLVSLSDHLGFRHELIRGTLLDTIPQPIRGALHRQAARTLRASGRQPVAVALQLLHGASATDAGAMGELDRAAREVLAEAPSIAARLAARGLELCAPSDPTREALTLTAAEALTRGGPLGDAASHITAAMDRSAAAGREPSEQTNVLRYWLSNVLLLTGDAPAAMAVCEQVRARPDVAVELRGRVLANLLVAAAETADETPPVTDTNSATAGCELAASALARWRAGRMDEAVRLGRRAADRSAADPGSPWGTYPALALAEMCTTLGDTDSVDALLDVVDERLGAPEGTAVLRAAVEILRARTRLATGDLNAAWSGAERGHQAATRSGLRWYVPMAWGVLATVALRRGDLGVAGQYADLLAGVPVAASRWPSPAWVAAQVLAARSGSAAAMETYGDTIAAEPLRRAMLLSEPTAAAWWVRTALVAGRRDTAKSVVLTIEQIAARNPDAAALVPAATHARGRFEADPDLLTSAIDAHRDPWCRASATEDLAVALTEHDQSRAIGCFDRAMESYGCVGADWDAARIRWRLRQMGVRRRHWTYAKRPGSGWASLTETEQAVARLVAQGLTNRKVAAQMFISPHTVGFHLRQVFRKLGVQSRVDLLRAGIGGQDTPPAIARRPPP